MDNKFCIMQNCPFDWMQKFLLIEIACFSSKWAICIESNCQVYFRNKFNWHGPFTNCCAENRCNKLKLKVWSKHFKSRKCWDVKLLPKKLWENSWGSLLTTHEGVVLPPNTWSFYTVSQTCENLYRFSLKIVQTDEAAANTVHAQCALPANCFQTNPCLPQELGSRTLDLWISCVASRT